MRSLFHGSVRVLAWVANLFWVIGGALLCAVWWIGWFLKDSYAPLVWFYFLPSAFVAGAGFLWLFLTLRHRFRLLQLVVFATVIASLLKVLVVDHHWQKPPATLPPENIRILHWNTARGVLGVESIMRTILDDIPDIVMISEPPQTGGEMADVAYHALGMPHVFSDAGMALASHYPITYLGNVILPTAAGWHALIETSHGPLEIVAVDVFARPHRDRRPILDPLARWLDARTNRWPLVIMGDFNTPHDAACLAPLRQRMDYAYSKGGRGWPYTWPVPVPLYAIDHTWVSRDITVQDVHYKNARFSDHKRQIIDLTFPDRRDLTDRQPETL